MRGIIEGEERSQRAPLLLYKTLECEVFEAKVYYLSSSPPLSYIFPSSISFQIEQSQQREHRMENQITETASKQEATDSNTRCQEGGE